MAAVRQARAIWTGDLTGGQGEVSGLSSSRFSSLPVSWAARTEQPGGKTSPEELLAAAHASCFAMALSARVKREGVTPERLDVTATVAFDKVGDGWGVTSSEIEVIGKVPGVDAAAFTELAEDAIVNCPISQALKGNVRLAVKARLA